MDPNITGPAIERIAELAQNAKGISILSVTVSGEGLPASFPVAFDHRAEGGGLIDLRSHADLWRLYPERRKGTAVVGTLAAFNDLTNRLKTAESVIFAQTSWPNPSLLAVIDYHGISGSRAGFREHRINYPFPLTDEFKAWAGKDGVAMDQADFAGFIEERVAELSAATGQEEQEYGTLFQTTMATPAEMLALSRGLEVNVAGKVKQNIRLNSGEQELVFTEEHQDSTGQKITVPGLFMVCVPAFLDGQAVRLPARLRYRVASGTVKWFYQLYRWKELLRERVVDDLGMATGMTDLPAYEGKPE